MPTAGLERHCDRCLERLASTRGASEHTLRAFGADMGEFTADLGTRGVEEPERIPVRALRGLLAHLKERGPPLPSISVADSGPGVPFPLAIADQNADRRLDLVYGPRQRIQILVAE